MDRPQIIEYIKNPSTLSVAKAPELEELTNRFPYCPVTHLLFTKALFEQNSMNYHAQLKKTAIHIPDRSVLYWLLKGGADDKNLPFFSPGIVKKELTESKSVEPEKEIYPDKDLTAKDTFEGLKYRLDKLSRIALPSLDLLEIKLRDICKDHEQRIINIVSEYNEKRKLREAEIRDQKEHAFDEKDKIIPLITGINIEEQSVCTESQNTELKEDKPADGVSKTDLIDRFITVEPGMPKPKKEFYNPVNMAHKSTLDSEDLVSETLAEVHLQQGNIEKALKIYTRLCLIIPEKSAYFAARIEKIKKENNLL